MPFVDQETLRSFDLLLDTWPAVDVGAVACRAGQETVEVTDHGVERETARIRRPPLVAECGCSAAAKPDLQFRRRCDPGDHDALGRAGRAGGRGSRRPARGRRRGPGSQQHQGVHHVERRHLAALRGAQHLEVPGSPGRALTSPSQAAGRVAGVRWTRIFRRTLLGQRRRHRHVGRAALRRRRAPATTPVLRPEARCSMSPTICPPPTPLTHGSRASRGAAAASCQLPEDG